MRLLNNKKNEIIELEFGSLDAGEIKDYIFYIENNSDSKLIDINVSLDIDRNNVSKIDLLNKVVKELEIIETPKELKIGELGKLIIRWNSSISVRKGLKGIILNTFGKEEIE